MLWLTRDDEQYHVNVYCIHLSKPKKTDGVWKSESAWGFDEAAWYMASNICLEPGEGPVEIEIQRRVCITETNNKSTTMKEVMPNVAPPTGDDVAQPEGGPTGGPFDLTRECDHSGGISRDEEYDD